MAKPFPALVVLALLALAPAAAADNLRFDRISVQLSPGNLRRQFSGWLSTAPGRSARSWRSRSASVSRPKLSPLGRREPASRRRFRSTS
ncbi:MAG: hypothetical protein GY719_11585 [bacterium]|nr:hypothetical protein [bacterium]